MSINNLWDDLEVAPITLPQTILDSAIQSFNSKTEKMGKNLFFKLKIEKSNTDNNKIIQSLRLNAPDLGGYSLLVLRVEYEVEDIYPCNIRTYDNLMQEDNVIGCIDAGKFEEEIVNVLSSPELKDIISKLLAQCPTNYPY